MFKNKKKRFCGRESEITLSLGKERKKKTEKERHRRKIRRRHPLHAKIEHLKAFPPSQFFVSKQTSFFFNLTHFSFKRL